MRATKPILRSRSPWQLARRTPRLWPRPASYLPQRTGGLLSVLLSSSSRAAASTQKCSVTHGKGPANARLHSCAASGLPNRGPSRELRGRTKTYEERREGWTVNAYGGDIVVVAMRDPSHARRDLHPQFTRFHAGVSDGDAEHGGLDGIAAALQRTLRF